MSDSEDNDVKMEREREKYIDSSDDLEAYGWSDISLRPYQVDGVNWMISRYYKGHGCILGDEMGLGKTCQTIAVLAYITRKSKKKMPNLVVCPRSVLENWDSEIKRFAPGLRSKVLIGEKEARQEQNKKMKSDHKKGILAFDVLITTYEICMKDATFLQSLPWNLLVVDEAHRLKNVNSLLYNTLSQWDIHRSILLTGTPVQNNLQELYGLLSFAAPEKFPVEQIQEFVDRFSQLDRRAKELHKLLKPFLILRTKAEVLKDLPCKQEVVLEHGISKLQSKLYKGILLKDTDVFESYGAGHNKQTTSLMNILMQLRKCVNHPYLFDGVEPEPFELGEHLVEASGKLVLIDRLLKYLHDRGHKVLLFSQMVHMLDILQDYLGYRGYSYERLDGSVRGEERFLAVRNFNANDETFAFLLSTRAGGQGINLTSADTVIFVDSDFNPQNDLQAAARAHRIGQTRPVRIVRLIGKNTVEEIILKRAEDKLKLTEKVIADGQFSLGTSKHSLFTDDNIRLQDILKYGVDELFKVGSAEEAEVDFTKILGSTVDGEWQPLEEGEGKAEEEEEEKEKMDTEKSASVPEELEEEGTAPQSMYMFEGTDYSKEPTAADIKAFDEMIEAEKAAIIAKVGESRQHRLKRDQSLFAGGLPDVLRKPRKKLSPEELEARRLKRKEIAEKRAKEAEEQELRNAQEKKKRRDEMWKRNDYKSCNISKDEDDNEEEDEEMEMLDEEDGGSSRKDIHYVSGDVTKPRHTDTQVQIVVHCADDAGRWGRGGLFSAISACSSIPEDQYTLAGNMQDLALGDCHLIPLDAADDDGGAAEGEEDVKPSTSASSDTGKQNKNKKMLGLIIAQHRDKRNKLSGIKLSALRYGLEAIYRVAKEKKGSVHLPRIGHDTPGFNWYGTEKLIKKHLAAKGIPTFIYYFPRKNKRKAVAPPVNVPPQKAQRTDSPSTSRDLSSSNGDTDSSIFSGMCIYLHNAGHTDEQFKNYSKMIISNGGKIEGKVAGSTTHVIVTKACDSEFISDVSEEYPDVAMISEDWLDDSVERKKPLKTINYEIS